MYKGKVMMEKLYNLVREFKSRFLLITASSAIIALCDTGFGLLSRYAIDEYAVTSHLDNLWIFITGYIVVLAVKTSARLGLSGYCWRTEIMLGNFLKKKIFKHVQTLPASFFDRNPVGQMISTIFPDTGNLGDQVGVILFEIPFALFYTVFITIAMLVLNAQIAIPVLISLPIVLMVCYLLQKTVYRHSGAVRELNGETAEVMNENISGILTVKTLQAENWAEARYRNVSKKLFEKTVSSDLFSAIARPFALSTGAIITGIVLWKGGGNVLAGLMTPGTLVLFIQYILTLYVSVSSLAAMLVGMQSARASAQRVLNLLDQKPDDIEISRGCSRSETGSQICLRGGHGL